MKIKFLFAFMLLSIASFGQQNPIQIDANGLTQTLTAGGLVVRGQIVKINSAGQVVPVLTTDTSGAIGVAATSQTSAGNGVQVSIQGTPLVQIDASGCSAGNIVSFSTTTGGAGHCASTASGQQVGVAISISSPGSNFWNVALSLGGGGGGVAVNSPLPAASSGPGPVFNVQNYGAKGNSQSSTNCSISGLTNLNCTDITFTSADVGKRVSCVNTGVTYLNGAQTVTAFVDAHDVTVSTGNGSATMTRCTIGTADDAAITTALAAALAQVKSLSSAGNLGIVTAAPTLYFPSGNYFLNNTQILIQPTGSQTTGFTMMGDGPDQTKLYWASGASVAGAAVWDTGFSFSTLKGFTLDGMQGVQTFPQGSALVNASNSTSIQDVHVQNFGNVNSTVGGINIGNSFYANRVVSSNNQGVGITCNLCQGEFYESGSSNNAGGNLNISGSNGLNNGSGFRWVNGLIDECGTIDGCVQVINSSDVWFQGMAAFGGQPSAVKVDGTSFIHWEGGIGGVFGNDNNITGLKVAAGGVAQVQDVRFVSSGTGNCIANSGTVNDNGGNTCESQFTISSGTSTGTTAVLTLGTHGANVNVDCAVGDALYVQNAAIVGYNGYYPAGAASGITAVTATTLTYTTSGSNLGALTAGGTAYCRNLLTYSGTLPRALLNNPIPNTCYITGTFAATTAAAPMCAFKLGSATNVNQIKATSTTTTACTVAPVVTISDGTVSETLTITSAKSIWDSSIDTSTGVGTTIFKPNGTITLSNTVGTCTTPPTNFSVSYNISPILSN